MSLVTNLNAIQPQVEVASVLGLACCCICLVIGACHSIYNLWTASCKSYFYSPLGLQRINLGRWNHKYNSVRIIINLSLSCICLIWLFIAAVPFASICNVNSYIPKQAIQMYSGVGNALQVASGYGLFRRMTGVGEYSPSVVARPEIILEGLSNETGTWSEIPFLFKPGKITKMPPFVACLLYTSDAADD